MGVDATIKPNTGDSLGTANKVAASLSTHFPGLELHRSARTAVDDAILKAFVEERLSPEGMTVEIRGATADHYYQGVFEGDGWAIDMSFDDSPNVRTIFLTMYGSFDLAEPFIQRLSNACNWTLSFE